VARGFRVDTAQVRDHAQNVTSVEERFEAVRTASAHIAGNDEAYGLLCGWIAGVLEGRHLRQDELIAYVRENLSLVVDGLRRTAERYDAYESDTEAALAALAQRLEPGD
jgi:hypothetical protein